MYVSLRLSIKCFGLYVICSAGVPNDDTEEPVPLHVDRGGNLCSGHPPNPEASRMHCHRHTPPLFRPGIHTMAVSAW
jgi:hypothetical protein